MADAAHVDTDKKIKKLEKNIQEIYTEAQADIEKKLDDFTKNYKVKEAIYQKELDEGKITQAQFDNWKKGQVFQDKQWQAKRDQIISTIHNSNTVATKLINGATYGVFKNNANYTAYDLEHSNGVNFGFGIYDTATMSKLLKDNPNLLPKWKIDEQKDYIWNKKKVNNSITQGILQGEKLDQITKRLSTGLASANENTMKTFARTAMTGAQNAGREQRLMALKAKGVNVVKQWMATLDGRTRHSHRMLDGETLPVAKDIWHPVTFSNGCRYPGDPKGPAAEVYNCRCTMVGDVLDYPEEYKKYDNIAGKPIDKMTYNEWKASKKSEAKKPGDKSTKKSVSKISSVITGKDISKTWIRRPNEFDFAIEDIINTQGFDGLPRVVNAEEFDRYVQESNIIMQRGYRAPNEETLKAYQDTLYNGKWYVDCSEGGSIYGKGMYTVYNKGTTIIDDIADTAKDYARPSRLRGLNAGTIETITLTSDAKIIKYEEIKDMLSEYNKIHSKIDEGSLAALYGYDAISVGQNDMGYLVILNRTKLVIKENTL